MSSLSFSRNPSLIFNPKGTPITADYSPLTDACRERFHALNKENLEFLMDRYNRVNRWVIADMVRRTAYHTPDKEALIFGDKTLT